MGTQIDLRDEADVIENRISYEMGENQAKDLRAVKYVECSALTQVGSLALDKQSYP